MSLTITIIFCLTCLQVSVFAKIDTHQPGNEAKHNVLALRYENLPRVEFEKSVLTTAITLGNLGLANQTKTFQGKREKASIIYLDKLPNAFVKEIVKGNGMSSR